MRTVIKTNHAHRSFVVREDVPAEILASQFDWTDEAHAELGDYSDGFLCYRGHWYHLGDFMRGGVEGWDGAHGDSYFSGVVIRVSDDGETYQIGTYFAVSD
jgi:hypothetical protein